MMYKQALEEIIVLLSTSLFALAQMQLVSQKKLYVAFIDFQKAFYLEKHWRILKKRTSLEEECITLF